MISPKFHIPSLILFFYFYSTSMRIKTAPRHRILQRDMKVMSAAGSSPDEETIIDVEKDYDSRYAIDRNSYQVSVMRYFSLEL